MQLFQGIQVQVANVEVVQLFFVAAQGEVFTAEVGIQHVVHVHIHVHVFIAQYVVYDDETYQASEGDEGYIVDVYLVTLDQAGKEISREFKYTDTYKTKTPKVYIGVTPRETPVPMDLFLID